MAVETKDLLKFLNLGIEDSEIEGLDIEKLKEKFTAVYAPQSELKKRTGDMLGRLGTKYKQLLQENGVDFVNSDIEDKPFEEVLSLGITKFKGKYSSEIDELKDKVGKGTGKEDEALLKKIAKLEATESEWNGKYTALQTEYEGFKTESTNKFTEYKLKNKLNEIHSSKIQWAQNLPEVAKKGYFATINDNYKVELDEQDNVVVKDKTGNPIPNPAVNNTFKTYEDILQEVGVKEGTWPINNHSQKQTPQAPIPAKPLAPVAVNSTRVINTSMRK